MDFDFNDPDFWGELGIKYEKNQKWDNLLYQFYQKYQKILREMWSFPKDLDKSIKRLKEHIEEEPSFLLEVYLRNAEKTFPYHDSFNISPAKLNISRKELSKIGKSLLIRLNKNLKRDGYKFILPKAYPNPYISSSSGKIWFVLKKKVGNAIKRGKKKRVYNDFPEKFIVVDKKKDKLTLRSSFKTQKEKKIIKRVFNSKKPIFYKENELKHILKYILENFKIYEISGNFDREEDSVNYSFSSEKELNDFVQDFGFDRDEILENVEKISFSIGEARIKYKIFNHRFGVKHIKMVTTGLTPSEISARSSLLSNEGLKEDIYVLSPKNKESRIRYILENKSVEGIDIDLLKKEIDLLSEKKIINVYYQDKYKKCENKEHGCYNYEDGNVFGIQKDFCPNCGQKLRKYGSRANIKKNRTGIKNHILNVLKERRFSYLGIIVKRFKKTPIEFRKIKDPEGREFLLYFHENKKSIRKLLKSFSEKALPVLVIVFKDNVANDIFFKDYCVDRVSVSNFFVHNSIYNELGKFKDKLETINTKQKRWKLKNMEESLEKLKDYKNSGFNPEKIGGKGNSQKGNTFEYWVNSILKFICNSWIELGQNLQNKPVPDGAGHINIERRKYVFGSDAKLKISKNSRGLGSRERKNQKKYIREFRKKSYGYGGLKCWLIVVKSEEDYQKFTNSIKKLKEESNFNQIVLLGVEPLLEIAKLYNESQEEGIINKEVFLKIIDRIVRHKGNITIEKVKKAYKKEKNNYEKSRILDKIK